MTGSAVPHIVIAGAAKCGTTSLHAWLGQHPAVTPSTVSEPGYFTGEVEGCSTIDDYRERFFPDFEAGTLTLEATPFYLYHPAAAEAIFAGNPHAKIVVSVRDPVDAVYSWYWHQRRAGEAREFGQVLDDEFRRGHDRAQSTDVDKSRDYLARYDYPGQIDRFVRLFGRDNVFVLPFDALRSDPRRLLSELEQFLGISAHESYVLKVYNPAKVVRGPRRKEFVKKVLKALAHVPFRRIAPKRLRYATRLRIRQVAFREFAPPPMDPQDAARLEAYFRSSWAQTKRDLDFIVANTSPDEQGS